MKTYIIHYTPLKERKIFMVAQIEKYNLDAKFIEKYDRENLTDSDYNYFIKEKVRLSQMSNMRKHISAWNNLINSNFNHCLVLEDDTILHENFKNILDKYLIELYDINKDFDLCFIGDGAKLHIHKFLIEENKNIYLKSNYPSSWGGDGATRCTDSYIISKNCSNKILKYLETNKIEIWTSDFWLNHVCRTLDLKVYWAEPTIVTQGTQNGLFKSSA